MGQTLNTINFRFENRFYKCLLDTVDLYFGFNALWFQKSLSAKMNYNAYKIN